MKRKNTERLKDVLLRFLNVSGLQTQLNEYRAVQVWPKVAGPAVTRLTGSVDYRNNTLYIKITRPALRQDLSMGRSELVRKINKEVGAQVIQNIVFY